MYNKEENILGNQLSGKRAGKEGRMTKDEIHEDGRNTAEVVPSRTRIIIGKYTI